MGLWDKVKNLLVAGDLEVKGKIEGPNVPKACDTVVTEKTFGQAESPGVSKNFSRCDHTHGTPPAPPAAPIPAYSGTYIGTGAGVVQNILVGDPTFTAGDIEIVSNPAGEDTIVDWTFKKNAHMEPPFNAADVTLCIFGPEGGPGGAIIRMDGQGGNPNTVSRIAGGFSVTQSANLLNVRYFFTTTRLYP